MDWTKIVTEALTPLIGLLLTLALGALFNWLLKAAGGIKQTQLRESLTAALNQAQTVALDAVTHTQQILVDELKARSEDGVLTRTRSAERVAAKTGTPRIFTLRFQGSSPTGFTRYRA